MFLTSKLINLNLSELEKSKNPFATVVMAHLTSVLEKDPIKRKDFKLQLIRMLKNKGFEKELIIAIFKFIDWLITLSFRGKRGILIRRY